MNEDTRVAVCCYNGDGHQVIEALEFFLHHGCPLTVLSPEDAKAEINYPGVTNVFAGKAAYIGQDSLDRQALHLAALLQFPENHFLIHDADSVCLDAKIPDYLYAEPDFVWSNQVDDAIPEHQDTFKPGWPHVAFQPPYFLNRKTIERMLVVKDHPDCRATYIMPFIDYYMVQLTVTAGLPWRRIMDCISCPISIDLRKVNPPLRDLETYSMGMQIAMDSVLNKGTNVLHSVKNSVAIRKLAAARQTYLATHPDVQSALGLPPVITGQGLKA
jgi:hypothetical protein